MKAKPGRPRKPTFATKGESIEIRVSEAEKIAFREAAEIAGIGMTTWMRERLRRIAAKELEDAGYIAAFLEREA
jgi:uncharacterized protein (DUF1778 family)